MRRAALLTILLTLPVLAQWRSIGPEGGAVERLVVDPRDASRVYAATTSGVFVSTDGGKQWKHAPEGMDFLIVKHLAIDADGAVYAGSVRTFRSTGGATWKALETAPGGFNLESLSTEGKTLYAGTGEGMFRSTDRGETWTKIEGFDGNAKAIATDRGTTYIAGESGIFRSKDGKQFDDITPDLPFKGFNHILARKGFVIAAGDSAVFRSLDGGDTWMRVAGHYAYPKQLAFDEGSIILVALGDVWRSNDLGENWEELASDLSADTFVRTKGALLIGTREGVLVSRDGGKTWTPSNKGLTARRVTAIVPKENAMHVGGDWRYFRTSDGGRTWNEHETTARSLAVIGSTVYAGTMQGVKKSIDSGATWSDTGLSDGQVNAIVFDNGTVYAGLDGGGVMKSNDGGSSWTTINMGLEGRRRVKAMMMDRDALLAGTDEGLFETRDAGKTWKHHSIDMEVRGVAVDGDRRWALTTEAIFFSSDRGETWKRFELEPSDYHGLLLVGDTLYLGRSSSVSGGGVMKSTDGGVTWTRMPGLTCCSVTTLALSTDGKRLYAGTEWNSVYETDLK